MYSSIFQQILICQFLNVSKNGKFNVSYPFLVLFTRGDSRKYFKFLKHINFAATSLSLLSCALYCCLRHKCIKRTGEQDSYSGSIVGKINNIK